MLARMASSTCFWLRWRSARGFKAMFSVATLRCPGPPIWADSVATSGSAATISSTCRTLASVRSRLEPTGMRSTSWVKPWSVCGTNSLPTSGASPRAATKLATPTDITAPRGVRVARRQRRGEARSRRPSASKPRPQAGSGSRQRRAEKAQRISRSYTPCSRSMPRSVARSRWPTTGTFCRCAAGGSFHRLDSMGSSVKLTNRLTSTATTTVMPKG